MFNLREAGKNRALLSNNKTAPTKDMSTFCPAERSEETDETGETSVGVGSNQRPGGRLRFGTISFRDMVGIEEFNVDLGGRSDDNDGWDQSEVQPSGQDVEQQAADKEAYEMDNARPTTSGQHVGP